MISDNQPHTYKDRGRKFYAFFENFDDGVGEQRFKGFHFYLFDQSGYCWFLAMNTSKQFIRAIANELFLQRTAWCADGLPYREPLPRDEWLDNNVDSAYALEMTRNFTGLDLMLIYKAQVEKPQEGE